MNEVMLVRTTFVGETEAREVCRRLIDERLAACVTITPHATSIYRWNGTIEQSDETVVLFKTGRAHADALIARLGELHEYDLPVIESWPASIDDRAKAWIERETLG